MDESGRDGEPKPHGLGRPTKRSVTFIVFAGLLVLLAIILALAMLFL